MRRSGLILLLAMVAIFGSVSISYSKWTVTKLSENSSDNSVPQINDNGQVVWMGSDGNDQEIFLYDGTAITQLTTNSYDDKDPQINNSGYVVWVGWDGNDQEIFLYDGTTITQLTNNSYRDIMPKINNNGQVVWLAEGNDRKIYLYNGTTTIDLTDNPTAACTTGWEPQINDKGQVVWRGFDGNNQVCYFDGTTVTRLTNNSLINPYPYPLPQINNNGDVVWEEWDGYDYEIYLYNGVTTTQLTNNSYNDMNPRINDSGEVVWMSETGQGWEIFLYDGTTKRRLTNNLYVDTFPRISNNGYVFWVRSEDDGDALFVYNGKITLQLSNGSSGEIYMHPQVNDSGQVVWYGWNAYGSEIYLALPPVKLMVLSPNGGEALASGSTETIRWTASEPNLHFNVLYSEDRGVTWKPIASSVTGNSHDWIVPVPKGNRSDYLVKVVGFRASGPRVGVDTSDGPFTIEVVKLETPSDPGISMNYGETYNITWTAHATGAPVETVELYYTLNATVVPISWRRMASFNPGDYPDGYPWPVPKITSKKTRCRVKVLLKDVGGHKVGEDISDNNFTIQPAP